MYTPRVSVHGMMEVDFVGLGLAAQTPGGKKGGKIDDSGRLFLPAVAWRNNRRLILTSASSEERLGRSMC